MYTTCIWTWNAIIQVLSLRNKMKIKLNSEIPFLFLLFQLLWAYLSWKIYIAEKLCLFLKSLGIKLLHNLYNIIIYFCHLAWDFPITFELSFLVPKISRLLTVRMGDPLSKIQTDHMAWQFELTLCLSTSPSTSLFIKSLGIHKFHLYCVKMCFGERRKKWFSHIVEHDQIIPAETDEM